MIPMRTVLLAALLMATALAGCSDTGEPGTTATNTTGGRNLKAGLGGIEGLLVDDAIRPIPGGLILLQPVGATTTSNANGEFEFGDLQPGQYELKVSVADHEAAPTTTTVKAGEYTEISLEARRVFNEGGTILTREFSVFIPCAADFVANGVVADCTLDLSGDTYRPGFTVNLSAIPDVTVVVTEMKASKRGGYTIQMREDDESSAGGDRYFVGHIRDSDYFKAIVEKGVQNTEYNDQRNNVPWNNTVQFATILFLDGQFIDEIQGAGSTACQRDIDNQADNATAGVANPPNTCRNYRGLEGRQAIRATFVQSVFIGPPEVDLQSYCALCS